MAVERTCSAEEAEEQEDDDTPDDVTVERALQLAALVARVAVVHHGLGLMTCNVR